MQRALLLDVNYMALSLVPWKKAVRLMVKGKAKAVDGCNAVATIKCANSAFNIPSIIRLVVTIPWKAHAGRMKFSRKNMYIRDQFICQYCGIKVGKNASLDHVIPKSRGGPTEYTNCVTSCRKCNNLKGNRTPDEAGMALKQKPKKPSFISLYRYHLKDSPKEWKEYIIGI